MVAPIFQRWTRILPVALDVFIPATEDVTTDTFYNNVGPNELLDMVNDPNPAATLRYEIDMFRNGLDTGRHFFTGAMDLTSAGRPSLGPVDVQPGNISFRVAQRFGAVAATSFLVKWLRA